MSEEVTQSQSGMAEEVVGALGLQNVQGQIHSRDDCVARELF